MMLHAAHMYSKGTVHIPAVHTNSFTVQLSPTSVHIYITRRVSLPYMYMLYFCTLTLSFPVFKPYTDIMYITSVALYFNRSERDVAMRIDNVRCGFL